jgi:hypothetical protein
MDAIMVREWKDGVKIIGANWTTPNLTSVVRHYLFLISFTDVIMVREWNDEVKIIGLLMDITFIISAPKYKPF